MLKKILALLLLILCSYSSFNTLLPTNLSEEKLTQTNFYTSKALKHVKAMSKKPHYLGSNAHTTVRNYIVNELNALGLTVSTQEAYSYSKWGNISKPKNILARIKGSSYGNKALLLLSHYDSSPHSSFGASDAASGVATILEGLRAYLAKGETPKNDIIVLITDSEELGLNGADIFVNQHPWAKDVGLVLNFEARGSGGPSYMLVETNNGNANLIKAFKEAKTKFPVANSLAYSIYKMLPNDTDLTRFRVDGNINGFNFAFIDDHYDYHTALDTYERLDKNTLAHQGSYLMPLLNYFSNANLTNLNSKTDHVYFNIPWLKLISYPNSWILPMLIIAVCLFVYLIFFGYKNYALKTGLIFKGLGLFLMALVLSNLIAYFGWQALKWINPQYNEMLHGFTYNGHFYIAAFACLTLTIYLWLFSKFYTKTQSANSLVGPIAIWLLISTLMAFKLKGASFFIIPVYFALFSLWLLIKKQQPRRITLAFLAFPLIGIMLPFVKMLPIGLGLNMLFLTSLFLILILGLLTPIIVSYKRNKLWAFCTFVLSLMFLIVAQSKSKFNNQRPKPNSLLYVLNADDTTAHWVSYDKVLDSWAKNVLGNDPDNLANANLGSKYHTIGSKYNTGFTYTKTAKVMPIPKPEIDISFDTIVNNYRKIAICITPQRKAQRIEVFTDTTMIFKSFVVNGVAAKKDTVTGNVFQKRNRLFSYYITDNEPLDMYFAIPKDQKTSFEILEASYNLLESPLFNIHKRDSSMIPKPFVLNDAIVVKKTIHL